MDFIRLSLSYPQFQIPQSEVMGSVVRDHAERTLQKAVGNLNPAALFESVVIFPAERVRHLVSDRLKVKAEAKAPRRGVKTLRLAEKLPGGNPKIDLYFAPVVVKRAILPRIVKFPVMTGSVKEKI